MPRKQNFQNDWSMWSELAMTCLHYHDRLLNPLWHECNLILSPLWPSDHFIVRWKDYQRLLLVRVALFPPTITCSPIRHLATCVTECSLIQAHILHFLPLVTAGTASSDLWPLPHLVYELTASLVLWSCSDVSCEHTLAFRPGN